MEDTYKKYFFVLQARVFISSFVHLFRSIPLVNYSWNKVLVKFVIDQISRYFTDLNGGVTSYYVSPDTVEQEKHYFLFRQDVSLPTVGKKMSIFARQFLQRSEANQTVKSGLNSSLESQSSESVSGKVIKFFFVILY